MMLSLGATKEQLIAQDVCARLTSVIKTTGDKEIAVKSATQIIKKMREVGESESLVQAIEAELKDCHKDITWKFPAN